MTIGNFYIFSLSIFNPEIVKQSLIVILCNEASIKQITAAFSCRYRQVLTEKATFFREFLAGIGKLYSSPALGEVPQAEGYIFQHLFNPRPLAWEAKGRGFIIT